MTKLNMRIESRRIIVAPPGEGVEQMFGKKKDEKLEELRIKALEVVNQNSPEFNHYVKNLKWKEKKFKDKGNLRTLGKN